MGTNLNAAAAVDLFQPRPAAPPAQGYGQQAQQPTQRGRQRGWTPDADFVPAQHYLNPGLRLPCVDRTGQPVLDADGNMTFKDVYFPKGMALDTMEKLDPSSSNPESTWTEDATERNDLLDLFNALCAMLAPGESKNVDIPHATPIFQIRHRKDNSVVANVETGARNSIAAIKAAMMAQPAPKS